MEHACNPLIDFTFDDDDKFAYVCSLAKPFGLVSSSDCMVHAGSILQMYSGKFATDDFATHVLSTGKHEVRREPLAGALGPCFASIQMSSSLRVLPGTVPYELGYSCAECKACYTESHS